MKKTDTSLFVLIFVSILFFIIAFYEAYRITSILEFNIIEILFTYETFIFEVLIILSILYIIVLIKFSDPYNKIHYILRRIYLIVHITIATLGYLLGLNLDYILGDKESFNYQPIIDFWIFIPTIVFLILIDVFILNYKRNYRIKPKWVDLLQLILTIMFALMFNIIVTDSTSLMGVFD